MSLPFDIASMKEAAFAMGIPPAHLKTAFDNPDLLRNLYHQFKQQNLSDSGCQGLSVSVLADEAIKENIFQLANLARARSEEESTLPPTKAPPLIRDDMIMELSAQREEHRIKMGRQDRFCHTFAGLPYGFSNTPIGSLKPIVLTQMLIRKTHKGAYLFGRVIAKPLGRVGITLGIEDRYGTPARLSIYNYPTLFDSSLNDLDAIFPLGAILLIREPTYKMDSDGKAAIIHVISPSDVYILQPDDPLLAGVNWRSSLSPLVGPTFPETADEWRVRGAAEFKAKRWISSAVCYTHGMKLDPASVVLRLNRAETYLRLGWHYSALCDVEAATREGPIADDILTRKARLRAIKSNYGLEQYTRVVEIAEEHQEDKDVTVWLEKAKRRIAEQTSGNYDWLKLFKEGGAYHRPDVANYVGPVEVREREGAPDVRGLFTTRDVKAGELLIVAKPLASGYPSDTSLKSSRFFAFNFLTGLLDKLPFKLVIARLIQRIWDDPTTHAKLYSLYAGPSLGRSEYPPKPAQRHPLVHPLISSVDIDVPRIEVVLSLNGFDLTPSFHYVGSTWKEFDGPKMDSESTAIYDLPSFCNHECFPSTAQTMVGDIMLIRASRDLKEGEEATTSLVSTDLSYTMREKRIYDKWGFSCKCRLCKVERIDGNAHCDQRGKLVESVDVLVKQAMLQSLQGRIRSFNLGKGLIAQLKGLYEDAEEWSSCPKPDLFRALCPLAALGYTLASDSVQSNIDIEMEILRSAGLRIVDESVGGSGNVASMPIEIGPYGALEYFNDRCIVGCICIAGFLSKLDVQKRAKAWMDAAQFLHGINVADDVALFKFRYAHVIQDHMLNSFLP